MALPIAALAIYAAVTGSPLLPQRAYLNLAVIYFAQRSPGNWDDATRQVGARFTGIRDALLYDNAAAIYSDAAPELLPRLAGLAELKGIRAGARSEESPLHLLRRDRAIDAPREH